MAILNWVTSKDLTIDIEYDDQTLEIKSLVVKNDKSRSVSAFLKSNVTGSRELSIPSGFDKVVNVPGKLKWKVTEDGTLALPEGISLEVSY